MVYGLQPYVYRSGPIRSRAKSILGQVVERRDGPSLIGSTRGRWERSREPRARLDALRAVVASRMPSFMPYK